jgi:23S rRNA pseudouridine955/2504/2580 synthase
VAIEYQRVELGDNDDGRRLDRIIKKIMPDLPIGRMYRALRSREIRVNGARGKPDTRVASGDILEIARYLGRVVDQSARAITGLTAGPSSAAARPDALEGRILFQNEHILAINKLSGELTHGPGSLEDLVRAHAAASTATGVSFRPGPINRLDRNTSGLVLFAVSLHGAREGARAIQSGLLRKYYLAVLDGLLQAPDERPVIWNEPLDRDEESLRTDESEGGTDAETRVRVLASSPERDRTLVEAEIVTGRTHQIRAHASIHGHPVTGDRKYGSRSTPPYLLHAWRLEAAPGAALIGFDRLAAAPPEAFLGRLVKIFGSSVIDLTRA